MTRAQSALGGSDLKVDMAQQTVHESDVGCNNSDPSSAMTQAREAGIHDRGKPRNETDPTGPIAVPPRQACVLLSIGLTHLYDLLNKGELDSYQDGRSRRITVASIHAYVERQIVRGHAEFLAGLGRKNRRRGR